MSNNLSSKHKEVFIFISTGRDYTETFIVAVLVNWSFIINFNFQSYHVQKSLSDDSSIYSFCWQKPFWPQNPNRDHLYRVHPIVEFLFDKFKSVYVPSKFVSIDEKLLLWKDQLIFKQHIPNKIR